jgi:hypothetical protein
MHVRITRAPRNIMQSACSCASSWQIEFLREGSRETDRLTGWTSARDPLTSLKNRLKFETQEQAECFAHARGWTVILDKGNLRNVRPKSYVDNFNPDRRRSGR